MRKLLDIIIVFWLFSPVIFSAWAAMTPLSPDDEFHPKEGPGADKV